MIKGNMRMQHWQGFINATININQVPTEYFSTERGSTLTRNSVCIWISLIIPNKSISLPEVLALLEMSI